MQLFHSHFNTFVRVSNATFINNLSTLRVVKLPQEANKEETNGFHFSTHKGKHFNNDIQSANDQKILSHLTKSVVINMNHFNSNSDTMFG